MNTPVGRIPIAALCAAALASPSLASDWDLTWEFSLAPPPGALLASFRDLAVVDSNTIFAGGRDRVMLTVGDTFAVTVRLDGNGDVVWLQRYLPFTNDGEVMAVVPDGNGGVLSVVQVYNATGPNSRPLIVLHYDAAGNVVWETQLLGGAPIGATAGTVANCAIADGLGGVLIGGSEFRPGVHPPRATVFRVDANGVELAPIAPFGNDVVDIHDLDRTVAGGYLIASGLASGNWAGLVDQAWTEVWLQQFDGATGLDPTTDGLMQLIEEDELGNVFVATVASVTGMFDRPKVARLDSLTGAVVSVNDPAPVPVSLASMRGLADRPGGGVYVLGSGFTPNGGSGAPDVTLFIRSVRADGSFEQEVDIYEDSSIGTTLIGLRRGPTGLYMFGRRVMGLIPGTSSLSLPRDAFVDYFEPNDEIGATYCAPAVPNSTGEDGSIQAFGSTGVADEDVVLLARKLPPRQFAMFVAGSEQGSTPLLGGSLGVLCIAGNLGRFNDSLAFSGPSGVIRYAIDTASIPTATGPIPASVGLTWYFQCWHRDHASSSPSNTTNAVSVTFD